MNTRRAAIGVATAFYLVAAAALAHAFLNYWTHAADYILEQHGFRQTQTAITTYWFLRDGFDLAYPLPVLGAPWSAPFELPLFQLLVAYVVKFTGLSVDTAGRAVSFTFFAAGIWPIVLLGRALRLPHHFVPVTIALYCCAPVYLFWGRTFMIESLALFLTLLLLALAIRAASADQGPSPGLVGAVFAAGALALTVKVTTAAAPFAAAGLVTAVALTRQWSAGRLHERRSLAMLALLGALALAFLCLVLWVQYSDAVKAGGEVSSRLQSDNLRTWNFGTAEDRLSANLWRATIHARSIPETLGAGGVLVLGLAVLARLSRAGWMAVALFLTLYLAPFLLFPRLHMVHNYYQYANAIYLVLAAGVVIAALACRRPVVALAIVVLIAGLQLRTFEQGYATTEGAVLSPAQSRSLQISAVLKNRVESEAAFLAFGLDWSSEVPYYSERRAVMVPWWDDLALRAAADPARFLGGVPLQAVVVCSDSEPPAGFDTALAALTTGAAKQAVAGCEVYSGLRRRLD
jgi:hypothetical protein